MTENHTAAERWRYLANIRQGIVSKLEKKLKNRDAEIATLKASLEAATARLALYDSRERA